MSFHIDLLIEIAIKLEGEDLVNFSLCSRKLYESLFIQKPENFWFEKLAMRFCSHVLSPEELKERVNGDSFDYYKLVVSQLEVFDREDGNVEDLPLESFMRALKHQDLLPFIYVKVNPDENYDLKILSKFIVRLTTEIMEPNNRPARIICAVLLYRKILPVYVNLFRKNKGRLDMKFCKVFYNKLLSFLEESQDPKIQALRELLPMYEGFVKEAEKAIEERRKRLGLDDD